MAKVQRRKVRQSSSTEYQSFTLLIDGWEPSYSFGLNHSRYFEGPYWEHLELLLKGVFLSPAKVKNRCAVLTLLADRREMRAVADPASSRLEPVCVGTLTIRGGRTDFLGSVPYDAMWGLVSILSCGAIRMLNLHGRALYRGKAKIETIHFARDIDPENW
jgi:hypothetical protein